MSQIALTRASELIHVTDTLEYFGESAERILEQLKLPMWHYCDADDLIPKHHVFKLMDRAARILGSPDSGLLVGEHHSLLSMGSHGKLVANSVSVHDALTTGCRLIHLHNAGSRGFLIEAGDEVWFCHTEHPTPKTGRQQKEQYALMTMIDNVRLGAGPSWRPAKISLQTHEAPSHGLREALGDPEIRIGRKSTAIAVPRELLAQPLQGPGLALGEDAVLHEERLRQTAPATHFPDALRQVAGSLVKQGRPPRVETMAEIAGLSVRSLQRRLAKHGITHIQIVDQARYQVATRLLEDADIRITDIAMELGYAESSHFARAFKRWAGISPREYRKNRVMIR